jgi:hypothetical protein
MADLVSRHSSVVTAEENGIVQNAIELIKMRARALLTFPI